MCRFDVGCRKSWGEAERAATRAWAAAKFASDEDGGWRDWEDRVCDEIEPVGENERVTMVGGREVGMGWSAQAFRSCLGKI